MYDILAVIVPNLENETDENGLAWNFNSVCGSIWHFVSECLMIVPQKIIILLFLPQAFVTDVHEDEISVAFENE